jgi:DHA2 family multidrug resistance protein
MSVADTAGTAAPGQPAAGGRAPADAAFTPRGGVFGFFLMVVGMFMAILDIQIVASSLPQIQAGVSASVDQITWVQTAYLIAEVVMIPLSGWLSRVMGTRWLFVASSTGFTLASVACAFSWSIESLIAFRAVQGFIGGAMIPTVFSASFRMFGPERRTMATVVTGLTATVAPAVGPTLGGFITQHLDWQWLFLVNVLPGLIVTLGVAIVVDIDRGDRSLLRQIDLPGILLVATSLGSLEFVLDEGPRDDWFQSRSIVLFATVSAVSFVLLFWRELTARHPVLELRTFRNRNFTVGCVLAFVLGMCLYGQSFIVPQVLAQVRDFNSLQIGQVMFVVGTSMFLTAPLAGRLQTKLDPRVLVFSGFCLVATGLWLNSHMTAEVGFWQLVLPQVVRGPGLILAMVPITMLALGTLEQRYIPGGSGMFNVFRNMGGAVGLALINTEWDGRYDRHYWWLVEELSSTRADVANYVDTLSQRFGGLPAIADPQLAAYQSLTRTVSTQANIMAWNDVFLMLAVLVVLASPLVLLLARPKRAVAPAH